MRANDSTMFPAMRTLIRAPTANSIPRWKRNYTSKILKSKFALSVLVSGLMDSPASVPVRGKFHENWRVQTAYRSSNTRRARPACKPSVGDSCRAENGSCSPTEAAPAHAWIPNMCSCYPVLPESKRNAGSTQRTISVSPFPSQCAMFELYQDWAGCKSH